MQAVYWSGSKCRGKERDTACLIGFLLITHASFALTSVATHFLVLRTNLQLSTANYEGSRRRRRNWASNFIFPPVEGRRDGRRLSASLMLLSEASGDDRRKGKEVSLGLHRVASLWFSSTLVTYLDSWWAFTVLRPS